MGDPWEDYQTEEAGPWEDYGPQTLGEQVGAMGQLVARGGTFGLAEDIGAEIAAPAIMALTNLFTDQGMSYGEARELAYNTAKRQQQPVQQFQEEHPFISFGAEIAGALPTGIGGARALMKTGEKFAPRAAQIGKDLFEKSQLARIAGRGTVGAGSAYLYGAGTAEEDRHEAGMAALPYGVAFGAGIPYMAERAPTVLGPAVKAAKEFLGRLRKPAEQAAKQAEEFLPVAGVTAEKVKTVPEIAAQEGRVMTLPKGVVEGDVSQQRVEHMARQGILGQTYQGKMAAVDQQAVESARGALQSMIGRETTEAGDELLTRGIDTFQKHARKAHRAANRLYKNRDNMLEGVTVAKETPLKTVVPSMKETMQTTRFRGAPEAQKALDDLEGIFKGDGGRQTRLDDLVQWRQNLNAMKSDNLTNGKEYGALSKLGDQFDDWFYNLNGRNLKGAGKEVIEAIDEAKRGWKDYKTMFGTNRRMGESSLLENMVIKEAWTPNQIIEKIYGTGVRGKKASIIGKGDTEQVIKRMLKASGDLAPEIANDMRSGLVLRAYNNALKGDNLQMGILASELRTLIRTPAFKQIQTHIDDAADFDTVVNQMIMDLDDFAKAKHSKYIGSTAGTDAGVVRMLRFIGKIPGARFGTEPIAMAVEQGGLAAERRAVDKTIKEAFDHADEALNASTRNVSAAVPVVAGIGGAILSNQGNTE